MSNQVKRKILETAIYEGTKSISLMDRFEGIEGNTVYEQLVLRNVACLSIDGKYEYLSLIVERSKSHHYIGNITFTELKQGQIHQLYDFLREQINAEKTDEYKDSLNNLTFSTPFLLRAQNSINKSGYGYGGTQYGETTAYVFIGAFIGYRKRDFTNQINSLLDDIDQTKLMIKNVADNDVFYSARNSDRENSEEIIELIEDGFDFLDEDVEVASDDDLIIEKRNLQDEDMKPEWYHAGFTPETNLFLLSLEQRMYLPPIIDECESKMRTDELIIYEPEFYITDMEKTFMFFEMVSNQLGYSGMSVLSLDPVHRQKIIERVIRSNRDDIIFGEYGDNTISVHIAGEFLQNQPELAYRGYAELIITKYINEDDNPVYGVFGGFRDFGENEVSSDERQYWSSNSRFLLDEKQEGSYLQGLYEMLMERR